MPPKTSQTMLSRVRTNGPLSNADAVSSRSRSPCGRDSAGGEPGDELAVLLLAGLDEPQAGVQLPRDDVVGPVRQGERGVSGLGPQETEGLDDGSATQPTTLLPSVDQYAAQPAACVGVVDAPHEETDDRTGCVMHRHRVPHLSVC